MSKTDFSLHIERSAIKNGNTLMEEIILYCKKTGIKETEIVSSLSVAIKDKIRVEAKKDGFLGGETNIPLI